MFHFKTKHSIRPHTTKQLWSYNFETIKPQMDLAAFIQSSGCELLNTEQPVENILKNDDKFVESDCDEQVCDWLILLIDY